MDFKTLMSTLFGFSAPTYYSWKKENRPIISLIDKYFTKEDLEQFLEKGVVQKYEDIDKINNMMDEQRTNYLSFNVNKSISIGTWDNNSLYLYFSFLKFLKEKHIYFNDFQTSFISYSLSLSDKDKHNNNSYYNIAALNKRIFPFLKWLDSEYGMYHYVTNILQDNLQDLTKVKDEQLLEEAKLHIDIFKNPFEESFN